MPARSSRHERRNGTPRDRDGDCTNRSGSTGSADSPSGVAAGIDRSALDRRRRTGIQVPVANGVLRLSSHEQTRSQRIWSVAAIPGSVIIGPSAASRRRPPPSAAWPNRRPGAADSVRTRRRDHRCAIGITDAQSAVARLPSDDDDGDARHPRPIRHPGRPGTLPRSLPRHPRTTVASVRALVQSLPPRTVTGRGALLDPLADRESDGTVIAAASSNGSLAGFAPPGWTLAAERADPRRAVAPRSRATSSGHRADGARGQPVRHTRITAWPRAGRRTATAAGRSRLARRRGDRFHLVDRRSFQACVDSLRQLGVGRPAVASDIRRSTTNIAHNGARRGVDRKPRGAVAVVSGQTDGGEDHRTTRRTPT